MGDNAEYYVRKLDKLKIVFYLFYISHFNKGLQINNDVTIICMSNAQMLD
jgi:hypothetical protein